jgi:hypothetical protein
VVLPLVLLSMLLEQPMLGERLLLELLLLVV